MDRREAIREFLEVLKKKPVLAKAIKKGMLEVVVRTKPRLVIYFRKKPKRKLSWQHFFMGGIYKEVRGLKGKIYDLPLSAYIAKKAFEKLTPEEKEYLRILAKVKKKETKYVSVNEKLIERLTKILEKKKLPLKYSFEKVGR